MATYPFKEEKMARYIVNLYLKSNYETTIIADDAEDAILKAYQELEENQIDLQYDIDDAEAEIEYEEW